MQAYINIQTDIKAAPVKRTCLLPNLWTTKNEKNVDPKLIIPIITDVLYESFNPTVLKINVP